MMTRTSATTVTPPPTANPPAGRRPALTLLVLLGPLSIAILRTLLPYGTNDSPTTVVAKVAAQPGAEAAVLWLSLLAGFTLVPGMIAVGLHAARRSRVLGTAALVVSVAGFSGLPAIVAVDQVAQSGTRANVPADVTARLLRHLLDEPTVAIPTMIFVAGHVAGVVLLGIALWRGGILPGWAGLVLSISQPLHLLFATIAPNPLLDGCAWLLTAAGLAFATARASAGHGLPATA
ncbi:hypothetical protein ETD86_18650 [Nonomuraea turkmeniaca]|uniref:DUF4386 family protein n=1 Tax=Nonomuraea turkmeniaca TaxID=103838 RepID=A0A5S4FIN0_9ACTN|nr:hypothetical protein [Nonomuraea turkmeniaca]TMR20563.1 hypothetical protein ETD86_18650 [Nonomuraea turkmeniaca]